MLKLPLVVIVCCTVFKVFLQTSNQSSVRIYKAELETEYSPNSLETKDIPQLDVSYQNLIKGDFNALSVKVLCELYMYVTC